MATRHPEKIKREVGPLLVNEGLLSHLVYIPTRHLKGYSRHARRHSARKLALLRNSIRENGLLVPLLATRDGTLITGHARLAAASDLGMTHVPVIFIDHLSEAQIAAFRIADNRLVELGTWDTKALALEFQVLIDFDIDATLTGFEIPEIDLKIQEWGEQSTEPDPFELVKAGSPVSSQGCIWRLGDHLVLCGNALDAIDVDRLMDGRPAAMGFIDPPYNVRIFGHAGGRGRIRHPEFAMASGEMKEKQYSSFLATAIERIQAVLRENSLAYFCIDWRSVGFLDGIARRSFRKPVNWVTWVKDAPGQGSFLRSQHEFVLIYCNGDGPFLNNVQLGRYGRNRSNVWNYPGVVGFNRERRAELAQHPTPKPIALVRDAIFDCTKPREIVLDTFLGGGATLMACERSGRGIRPT